MRQRYFHSNQLFTDFAKNVHSHVQRLKVVLKGFNGRQKERVWIKNSLDGEMDDSKLVEGIIGERAIYKRRGLEHSSFGSSSPLPKRLRFVFDVSGSMYRFNSYDKRLIKSLETALMIMQSLQSLGHKYVYDITGHSGDSANIPFVKAGQPPKNEKEMIQILQQMWVHSQYCWAGDNTLTATSLAIKDIVKDEADDYYVVVISDANLKRYGIKSRELSEILEQDAKVSAVMLFIGSIGEEANNLAKQLPKGRSFVVQDTSDIPEYIKEIFTSLE